MDVQCLTPTLAHTSLQCGSLSSSEARILVVPATLYLVSFLLFIGLAVARRSSFTARSIRAGLVLALSGCIAFVLGVLDVFSSSLRSPADTSRAIGILSTLPVLLHLVTLRLLCGSLRRAPDRFLLGLGVLICTFHLLISTLDVSLDPRPRFASLAARRRSNGMARTEIALMLLYYAVIVLAFICSLDQRRYHRSTEWTCNDKRSSSTSAQTQVLNKPQPMLHRLRSTLAFTSLLLFAIAAALDLSRPSNFDLQFTSSLFGALGYLTLLAFCLLHAHRVRGLLDGEHHKSTYTQGLSRLSTTGATRGHGRGSLSIDMVHGQASTQRHIFQAIGTIKEFGQPATQTQRGINTAIASLSRSVSEPGLRRTHHEPPVKQGSEASWMSGGLGSFEAPRSSADVYTAIAQPLPAHLAPGDVSDRMEHVVEPSTTEFKLARKSSSRRSSFTLHPISTNSSLHPTSSAHASASSLIALRRSLANLASVFHGSPPPGEQDVEAAAAGQDSPFLASPVSPLELEPAVSRPSSSAPSQSEVTDTRSVRRSSVLDWQGRSSFTISTPATTAYDPLLAHSLHCDARTPSSSLDPRRLLSPLSQEHELRDGTLMQAPVVPMDLSCSPDAQLAHLQELDNRLVAMAAEANLVGLGINLCGSDADLRSEFNDSASSGPCVCARCRARFTAQETVQPHVESEGDGDGDDEASSAQHELARIVRRALRPTRTASVAEHGCSDSYESEQRAVQLWRRRRPSTPLDFPVRAGSPLLLSPLPVRKTSAPELSTRWGHVETKAPLLTLPDGRSGRCSHERDCEVEEEEGRSYETTQEEVLFAQQSPLARFASHIATNGVPRESIIVSRSVADQHDKSLTQEPEEKQKMPLSSHDDKDHDVGAAQCETCTDQQPQDTIHTC